MNLEATSISTLRSSTSVGYSTISSLRVRGPFSRPFFVQHFYHQHAHRQHLHRYPIPAAPFEISLG